MSQQENCPCGSSKSYIECCNSIHANPKNANSAEELMRSRYCAFVKLNIEFIYDTFHPNTRRFQSKKDIENWAKENKWMHLEVLKSTDTTVEFKAHYLDVNLDVKVHHEQSTFKRTQNCWFYLDGRILS
ncbi:zinc chelation protein SecC [Sphingobacterium sp. WQ 366]|uniref:Zinc chelation protein SecC n=2 Tax=Sphingobacterium bovistauri TaxID=2781959 RepID=A0ABS7Z8N9_9SPHI|nr:zinc chelation protein SecC [Sphingobacterium bovistauri]